MKIRRVAALPVLALPMLASCRWVAVGDSITLGAKDEFHAQLGGDGIVDGVMARSPYQGVNGSESTYEAIVRLAPGIDEGGYLIVQDDGSGHDFWSYGAFIDDVESVVRDDVCIVWVKPYTILVPERDAGIAAAIDAFADQRHAVVPWGAIASAGDPGWIVDLVHPSHNGNVVLVDAIEQAMAGC